MTQVLTEEDIQSCIDEAEHSFRRHKAQARGQMGTPQDMPEWHYVAVAERMILAKLAKAEPVAEVVWFDPELEMFTSKKPHKIIDGSMAFMDQAPLGTKLYLRAPQAVPECYEARRMCHGDDAWSNWQPCTAEQAERYAMDETFQVRKAAATSPEGDHK